MQWLNSLLMTLQVISSITVIALVLLQQGKGADMGAAFGSGSAGSVFGSAGAANFLSRATKWAAILFFVTTGALAWIAHHPQGSPLDSGLMQGFMSSDGGDTAPTGTAVPSMGGDAGSDDAATNKSAAERAVPGLSSDADGQSSAGASSDASVPSIPAAPSRNND